MKLKVAAVNRNHANGEKSVYLYSVTDTVYLLIHFLHHKRSGKNAVYPRNDTIRLLLAVSAAPQRGGLVPLRPLPGRGRRRWSDGRVGSEQ